ncbi:MAG: hypothetical protein ACI909_002834, partial [Planctomycetota bacterium]
MTSSMTAFARLEESGSWGRAVWEIRTVNHRYLEMSIRLPDELRMLETTIREHISAQVTRGKVDCNLRFEADDASSGNLPVNSTLAEKLIRAAESLPFKNPAPLNPLDILRWPGVIERGTLDIESLGKTLVEALDKSLELLLDTRRREGEKLQTMLLDRCALAIAQVHQIRDK